MLSVDKRLSKNWLNDENSVQVDSMKLEVFRVLELRVLVIDRSFSVLMYEFATELMSIAASMLSLLIC